MDIRSSINFVPQDVNFWIFHAGLGKVYFDDFRNSSRCFIEAPYITSFDTEDAAATRQRVRMSLAYRKYHRRINEDLEEPSADPGQYEGGPFKGRSERAFLGIVRQFFSEMRVGDYIITAGSGPAQPVLIGRITSGISVDNTINLERYGDAPVSFREVEWLSTNVKRRQYQSEIADYFGAPKTITKVSHLNEGIFEVLDAALGSYFFRERCSIRFSGSAYDGRDIFALVSPTQLIALGVAAYYASANPDVISSAQSIEELIYSYFSTDEIISASQSATSPGWWRVSTANLGLAVFVASFVGIAASGLPLITGGDFSLLNFPAELNQQVGASEESLKLAVDAFDPNLLENIQKKGAEAAEKLDFIGPLDARP